MRKTKIICTIGPASNSEEVIRKLAEAGMNVARFNFSHGTHEQHKRDMDIVKRVRQELGMPIAIMLDTKGPEYRVGTFENGSVTLVEGQEFAFTSENIVGNNARVSVSYNKMIDELLIGDTILLCNGLVSLRVVRKTDTDAICTVVNGGVVSNRKSMSFPNKVLHQKYLSENDKKDLLFGIENEVDFIACSFVSCKEDINDVRNFMRENGGCNIDLIAKIENRAGVDNIEEIITASDGIMVARGDMGVEIPFEQLPAIQKKLITKCRIIGKRSITATEMLESMITNPRPTRAEISDVANAVYDGTSAIMLSGETAAGKYPVESVKAMSKIAEETESNIDYKKRFKNTDFQMKNTIDAISHSTCGVAIDIEAKAIVVCSLGGGTVRMVSRFRAPIDIIGLTTNERAWRKLALSWAVTPVMSEEFPSTEVLFYHAGNTAKSIYRLAPGDKIVITGGITNGKSGNTNLIKIHTI
jgi:pyruvate kinase